MKDWLDAHDTLRDKQRGDLLPAHAEVPDPSQRLPASVDRRQRHDGRHLRAHRQRSAASGRRPPASRRRSMASRELDVKLTDARERRAQPARRSTACARSRSTATSPGARARSTAPTSSASEWKYVPIRRLALMIEESLFRGTKWVVFEPNDEPLWAKIRLNVGAFMMSLFRQGAFQGATPEGRVLREVRRRDHDPGRSQPGHREHPGRLRAAQAGRVRRHQHPADRWRPLTPRGEPSNGQYRIHRQRLARRPLQELQVPRAVGRQAGARHSQGRLAQAHDRGRQAPQRRREQLRPQVAGSHELRRDHARARHHARSRVREVGEHRSTASPAIATMDLASYKKDLTLEV